MFKEEQMTGHQELVSSIKSFRKFNKDNISKKRFSSVVHSLTNERNRITALMAILGIPKETMRSLFFDIRDELIPEEDLLLIKKMFSSDYWNNRNSFTFDPGVLSGPPDANKIRGCCNLWLYGKDKLSEATKDRYPKLRNASCEALVDSLNWNDVLIERIARDVLSGNATNEYGISRQKKVEIILNRFDIKGKESMVYENDRIWDFVTTAKPTFVVEMSDSKCSSSGVTNRINAFDLKKINGVKYIHFGCGAGLRRRTNDFNKLKSIFDYVFEFNLKGLIEMIHVLETQHLNKKKTPRKAVMARIAKIDKDVLKWK